MTILYGTFSYGISGSFTVNKPSIAWSIYETTYRDGWPSDTFAPTLTKELEEVAQEYNYTISPDSHQLGLSPKIYLIATIRYILNNPSKKTALISSSDFRSIGSVDIMYLGR